MIAVKDATMGIVARYQKKIYALILYLVGQDQETAYDVCVASFVEALRENPSPGREEVFMLRLIGISIEKCRNVKTIPTYDIIDVLDIGRAEKEPLQVVLKALQMIDFEMKVPLLLRYQLNLSYRDIGTVTCTSDANARIMAGQARAQLDKEIDHVLNKTMDRTI